MVARKPVNKRFLTVFSRGVFLLRKTSRDRPKSAPYPRLKNSKKTSPSFKYSLLQYSKIENFTKKNFSKKLHTQKNGPSGAPKGGHFRNCQHFCRSLGGFVAVEGVLSQNIKKLKGENFYFRKKISQCRKKLKGGTLWDFSTSILSQNSKKLKGGPFEEKKFRKKSRSAEKNWKWGPFGLAGYGMLRGKTGKTFWFSSLDQIVQFGALIFCRTFVELFWSVRVD